MLGYTWYSKLRENWREYHEIFYSSVWRNGNVDNWIRQHTTERRSRKIISQKAWRMFNLLYRQQRDTSKLIFKWTRASPWTMFACLEQLEINPWFLFWKKKEATSCSSSFWYCRHSLHGFGEAIEHERAACPNYATAALLKLINGSSFRRNAFTIFLLLISKRQSMVVNVYESYAKCST